MHAVGVALTLVVALQHLAFMGLEMFLWQKPIGRRIFATSETFAGESAALAMNQGLYNGFLAAGLGWSCFASPQMQHPLALFFLACVVVAGVFGAATVSRRILVIQALPAAVALVFVVAA